jgi:hypothetical protein
MEIAEDHVHIFLGFPPRYSISQVVQRLKGRCARGIFQRYPEVKKELWGGEFWEDGYFARTVGDKVTKDVIKKYIEYHQHRKMLSKNISSTTNMGRNCLSSYNCFKAPPFKAGMFYLIIISVA